MKRLAFLSPLPIAVAFLLAGGLFPGPALAQGTADGDELPKDQGTQFLLNAYKSKDVSEPWKGFLSGNTVPNEKDTKDMKVIDTMAQWYTYRLTWSDYLNETKRFNNSIPGVHSDLDTVLKNIATSKTDVNKFSTLFSRQLVTRVKDVMEKGPLRARVNGAIMLVRLGKTGQQPLVENMVEILGDPKYADYLKLYAIKALKELFERQPPSPANAAARKALIGRYAKAVNLLIPYIAKNPEVPKDALPGEKKRMEDVHRYFRREAIRALAQLRLPALEIDAKASKVEGPVGFWLLKVVANDGLIPGASVAEQVEAACGLLLLRSDGTPFQNDVSVFVVGKFIEKELAIKYNADWERTTKVKIVEKPKKGEKPRGKEPIAVRAEPWKIHSARLLFALEDLKTSIKDPTFQKKVDDILNKAKQVLSPMHLQKPKQVGSGR